MPKSTSAEYLKLRNLFDAVSTTLREPIHAERRKHPLAYWTMQNDRRLPLALLDRRLEEVIATPFDTLASTPGIGAKKMNSLLVLLERATKEQPPSIPIVLDAPQEPVDTVTTERFRPLDSVGCFDAALVSEALWREWRDTIELHDLGEEKLGHLAPSLRELPTVIWETPLKAYLHESLASIRAMRTHGEKRVRVVLEVFFVVHEMLNQAGRHSRLSVRLDPNFVQPLERWFAETMANTDAPTASDIRDNLLLPLVEQVENDAGDDLVKLVKGRLGIDGNMEPVRKQSREMGVTRARVYQMLEECPQIMDVRWPQGRRWFQELATKLQQEGVDPTAKELFLAAYDLFFPRKYERVEAVLQS